MSFEHLNSIYRNYDIRGEYPSEINEDEVEKIGKALVLHFKAKKIAIGRDIRPSADALFLALAKGIASQGCDVIDLGLTTTPMTYFFGGSTDVDATVMITASHMPSQYNGLKITVEDSKPVTADILQILKDIVGTHTFSTEGTMGKVTTHAMQPAWIDNFKSKHDLSDTNFKVVIDPANMIGALDIDTFKAFEPDITVHTIYDEFDHTCPNHEANPIKLETLADLGAEVICQSANIGIAFDGDADRVGFVDETGRAIPSDLIGALLAKFILKKYPESTVVYDVRSSKSLSEIIHESGGTPVAEKVGHTNIKHTMRAHDAVLGIELAGHFFFKETYFSEGGPLPAFMLLELMKNEKKSLSELVHEVSRYEHSGEINSEITRTSEAIYTDLQKAFPEAIIETLDGLTLVSKTWWCNVRPSGNDPVMRLNLEADTKEIMEKRTAEVLEIIRSS
ncbi:MAG: phosphomannomutase [Candidatus Azotimanducaceae bacterium]|jgi:phosphomannomutase